jgi:hypothetical protein
MQKHGCSANRCEQRRAESHIAAFKKHEQKPG